MRSLILQHQLLVFVLLAISVSQVAAQPTATTPDPIEAEGAKASVIDEEPKPELERPTVWGEPTEVQVAIYVIDVDEVNSADQSFAASVYFEARWKNPLLEHVGPGPKLRSLTDVWNPRLTIIGQQMMWRSYPDSVEIRPDGTVVYRQKIWGRFSQPLSLQDFPFDQQELSIHIVAAGLLQDDVKMVPLVTDTGYSVWYRQEVFAARLRCRSIRGFAAALLPSRRPSWSRRIRNENRYCAAVDLLHLEGHHSTLSDCRHVMVAALD